MLEESSTIPNPVSLSKAVHPCPPSITEHLLDISSVHDNLAESTVLESLSHRARETLYELEPVTRALGNSFSRSLTEDLVKVSDVRNARKAAFEKEMGQGSNVQARIQEEARMWKDRRKALDDELRVEEANIEEDFKRGLRDAAKLGLSL
ncbi:hypothetical protein BJ508DRAFT_175473 [Ascobolus immersus RN42]|uniref:Uncharacterized protein n=1 Tax=Ascobolus immersus RN42 TaxID=1160509 RepID=A0A3N4HT32_ASCIM|nr:hypothetical protein BJ508DRAFT_175473 [Ascobolus immersus RN42]